MDKRTVLQPLLKATKEEFDAAFNNGNSVTNIVEWEGDPPAAGYYRQGGTLIWLFEQAEGTSIGFAVCRLMYVYKFCDKTDGNFAFVVANSLDDAKALMQTLTSLEFEFLESRPIEQIKIPFTIYNNILPF